MLDRRGLDETDAHLNQLSEVQHGTKLFSWQVGLKKSQEDQMVSGEREKSQEYQMVSSESFTQSKKDALKLVTQKETIEKFTKDDTNRKVLKCTKCSFTTSAALKKCKARKQIKQHEAKHNEEDLPKTEETSDVVGAITLQHTPGEEDIADGHVDGPAIIGKSALCNFFKFEHPDDILPDMDCNFKAYNSQELKEHIRKEHHKINIETAQHRFNELWE